MQQAIRNTEATWQVKYQVRESITKVKEEKKREFKAKAEREQFLKAIRDKELSNLMVNNGPGTNGSTHHHHSDVQAPLDMEFTSVNPYQNDGPYTHHGDQGIDERPVVRSTLYDNYSKRKQTKQTDPQDNGDEPRAL